MTDYNNIPQADIDTDSPIDESLLERMRDNPIAITEGAAGAPKIQTAAIQDGAVTSPKIPALAILTGKLADLAVTAGKIAAGAVTNAKIAAQAVTTDKINALAVTTPKIADLAVTTAKINDLAVTTPKIADLAVTSPKINNQAVKSNHLSIATVQVLASKPTFGSGTSRIAIPNGVFSLGVEVVAATGSANNNSVRIESGGAGVQPNQLTVIAAGGFGGGTCTGQATYITASPPYELEGEKANAFVYILEFNKPGEAAENAQIAEVYASESPPWITYKGFNILPDSYQHVIDQETGEEIELKCFKQVPVNKPEPSDPGYLEWMQNPEYENQEITPDFKNTHLADMPHPWKEQDLTAKVAAWLPEGEEMAESETWADYFTLKFLYPHCEESATLLNMLKENADVAGFIYGGGITLGDKMESSLLPEIDTFGFSFT